MTLTPCSCKSGYNTDRESCRAGWVKMRMWLNGIVLAVLIGYVAWDLVRGLVLPTPAPIRNQPVTSPPLTPAPLDTTPVASDVTTVAEPGATETGATATIEQEMVMIDFADTTAVNAWYSRNDDVMGGISESTLVASDTGSATFQGVVRAENNGGFATVQTDFSPARNLQVYDGLQLRVRGDGKQYGVYLRSDNRSVVYQATFVTSADTWQVVRLAWRDFLPTRFGQVVMAPAIDPSTIRSLSLLIEFKQFGPFALEVKHIGVFEE